MIVEVHGIGQGSGIKHVRNDDGKALSRQAYHEATEPAGMFVSVRQSSSLFNFLVLFLSLYTNDRIID